MNKEQETHQSDMADVLVQYLEMLGVEYVFGIPGGAIEPFYNALARSERRGGIRPIVARHESGAVFMADGYARESGKLGVCCATTGPGATNLITGMSSAYIDHIPILAITAQTDIASFGRGAFQESSFDTVGTVKMIGCCTHYSSPITHPMQFETKLTRALMMALRDKGGPVHLSIPVDIFRLPAQASRSAFKLQQYITKPQFTDSASLESLCTYLSKARKVVILAGSRSCQARDEILQFAEIMQAPIVTTPQGKTCISAYHPLNYGVFGFAGHKSAFRVMQSPDIDLVLACGTDLSEWETSGWDTDLLMNEKLVVIDNLRTTFQRAPMAELHVFGDITTVFSCLIQHAREKLGKTASNPPISMGTQPTQEDLDEEVQDTCYPSLSPHIEVDDIEKIAQPSTLGSGIKPQRLMCQLSRLFPASTCFLVDTGNSFVWSTHYLFCKQARAYHVSMGFSSMGWAIGAAVGTALADKERPVVAITGDGSFLMHGMELTVAVQERLPTLFVILNDSALGMVMHGQRLSGAEKTSYQLPPVDFAAMAHTLGANGIRIERIEELSQIDYTALHDTGLPTVLDIAINREEVPPMGLRIKGLQES